MFGRVIAVGISQRGLRLVAREIWIWAGMFLYRDGLRRDPLDLVLDSDLFCHDRYRLVQFVVADCFVQYNTDLLKQVGVVLYLPGSLSHPFFDSY